MQCKECGAVAGQLWLPELCAACYAAKTLDEQRELLRLHDNKVGNEWEPALEQDQAIETRFEREAVEAGDKVED